MTLHVGDVSSTVEVQAGAAGGSPDSGGSAGGDGAKAPSWDERQRHRRLVEDLRRDRARLADRGFDG